MMKISNERVKQFLTDNTHTQHRVTDTTKVNSSGWSYFQQQTTITTRTHRFRCAGFSFALSAASVEGSSGAAEAAAAGAAEAAEAAGAAAAAAAAAAEAAAAAAAVEAAALFAACGGKKLLLLLLFIFCFVEPILFSYRGFLSSLTEQVGDTNAGAAHAINSK